MSSTVTSEIGPWAMVPAWVLSVGLKGAELAVYVSLRSFANMQGAAHPHVKTIARRAGVSERTAERAIARLRDLGLLSTTRRYRDDGSIAGCDYTLRDMPLESASWGTDARVARGTDEDDASVPTHVTEQEHTTEHTSYEHLGSSDPWATKPPDDRQRRSQPATLTQAEANEDFARLKALCSEVGQDDPVSVWWTLRHDHRASHPAAFMARLVEFGEWDGFVGRHGIGEYTSTGEAA